MKKLLILLPFLLWPGLAFGAIGPDGGTYDEIFYVAEAATGDGSGSDANNCKAAEIFINNVANWAAIAAVDGKIGYNDSVVFVGTILGQITIYGTGASGTPITFQGNDSAAEIDANGGTFALYCQGAANNYITVKNLILSGGATGVLRFDTAEKTGYVLTNITLRNGVDGFQTNQSLTDLTVTNMTIDTMSDRGMQFWGALTCTNCDFDTITIDSTTGEGIWTNQATFTGCTMANITITNSGKDGILYYNSSSGLTMSNMSVSLSALTGISCHTNSTLIVEDSSIFSNVKDNILTINTGNITLNRCLSYDAGTGNGAGEGDGITGHNGDTVMAKFCIFRDNYSDGAGFATGSTGYLYNCTFIDNDGGDTRDAHIWATGTADVTVKNCVFAGSTTYNFSNNNDGNVVFNGDYNAYEDNSFYWSAAITLAQWRTQLGGCPNSDNECNSINSAIQFVDPSNGDFRLLANSPCINTGTNPFSNGDGNQYDFNNYMIWSDATDLPTGSWSDGPDIGAYGKLKELSTNINGNDLYNLWINGIPRESEEEIVVY